tara:strand:- start:8494 stop:9243 length:750 start_codon:yes stop_codon:yes gene_type:complete
MSRLFLNGDIKDLRTEVLEVLSQNFQIHTSSDSPLIVKEGRLVFLSSQNWQVCVNFYTSETTYMRQSTLGKKQPLFRALGIGKGVNRVLDATAGLGGDLFKMACMGFEVVGYEREPSVYALLLDGVIRSRIQAQEADDSEMLDIMSRIDVRWGDASRLDKLDGIEAIYFDPMFPHKSKGALSSKEIQALQSLCSDYCWEDQVEEFQRLQSISNAKRLVVKRPLKALAFGDGVNHSYEGKSLRYDLYVLN